MFFLLNKNKKCPIPNKYLIRLWTHWNCNFIKNNFLINANLNFLLTFGFTYYKPYHLGAMHYEEKEAGRKESKD